ncbi:MAG: ATP-binding cassette domain-containing protein [Gemmatimonadota bacterium]
MLNATGLGRRIEDAWIWREEDLRLDAGKNLAIVGPTGAGKSMLLRCLAGLDAADEGRIAIDDKPIDEWQMPAYRARIVYVHQRPALWEGTVDDNLRAVFHLTAHRSKGYKHPEAIRRLETFDRDAAFLGKNAADLSGGEAQIVALIRALSVDEAPGRASVWTSHDGAQVKRVADRTLTLDGSRAMIS